MRGPGTFAALTSVLPRHPAPGYRAVTTDSDPNWCWGAKSMVKRRLG
jgi:hypothetical protein